MEFKDENIKNLRTMLARKLAGFDVQDQAIDKAASLISDMKYPIKRLDICAQGLCLDYFLKREDLVPALSSFVDSGTIRDIKVFPYGILIEDLYHVRLTKEFEGILPVIPSPGR